MRVVVLFVLVVFHALIVVLCELLLCCVYVYVDVVRVFVYLRD